MITRWASKSSSANAVAGLSVAGLVLRECGNPAEKRIRFILLLLN